MKAVRFHSHGGPEVLRLDDIPVPVSQAGEPLVRVRTDGLNCADIYQRTGVTPTALPHIGGLEGVGVIETSAGGHPGNVDAAPGHLCGIRRRAGMETPGGAGCAA